jgi:hypothetical protein
MAGKPRVIRDFNHPDFPHGTPAGRVRGCPCDPCKVARRTQKKRAKLRRERYGETKAITPGQRLTVVRHVEHLRETVPGASLTAVCAAAGVSHCALRGLNRDEGNLGPRVARAILAVTPDTLAEHVGLIPAEQLVAVVRKTQALGYPLSWQSRRSGVSVMDLVRSERTYCTSAKAKRLRAIAAEVGDTPATPENTGTTQRAISKAKSTARSFGFYPPACYDEDGTLDYRAIPDHPWSMADEQVHRKIGLLRAVIEHDGTGIGRARIGMMVGEGEREVERVVARFKLALSERRRPKRIAWLDARLNEFEEDATLDPVKFALDIGLFDPDSSLFPRDHPGYVAWRAAHPEWLSRTERKSAAQRDRRAAAREVVDLSTDTEVLAAIDAGRVAA